MDHFKPDFLQLPARTVIITRMKSITTFRDLSEFQTCELRITSTCVKFDRMLWGPNSAEIHLECQYWDQKNSWRYCELRCIYRPEHVFVVVWLCKSQYTRICWTQKQYRLLVTLQMLTWIHRHTTN